MIIQPIVEGPGDEKAIPKLLFRIFQNKLGCQGLRVLSPFRLPRHQMVQEERCRHHLRIAQASSKVNHVMIFIDGDDDCCMKLKEVITPWANEELQGKSFDVIGIEKEFEGWLLASIESLAGFRGVPLNANPPHNPNQIRGAKEALSRMMEFGYSETADQGALTSLINLDLVALRCPSFERLLNKMNVAHSRHCAQCVTIN